MLNEESFEGDSEYFDDEIYQPKKPNILGILASVALFLLGSLFVKSTLAGNLTINTSGTVQFGQGQTAAPSCAGTNNLIVTPKSSFSNSANSGTQMFGSVSISGVSSECYGKDLIINAYDSSSNNPLALFGVSSTDIGQGSRLVCRTSTLKLSHEFNNNN